MTTDQVNYMNIGLMILAGIVALFLPFELFLFSYVILGPLHYLTELSWLHKRQYFFPGKRDYFVLALLSLVILSPAFLRVYYNLSGQTDLSSNALYIHVKEAGRVMVFVSFAVAAVLVFVRNGYMRAIAIALAFIIGFVFREHLFITILFALFVPTLIHVFIFTGAFILVGALKGRSVSGILSLIVFISCSVALFLIHRHPVNNSGTNITSAYDAGFSRVNAQLFAVFLHQHPSRNDLYYSHIGILVMRFIAFAYTYHYLNWFSKTSVIKWHQVPKRSLALVLILWILSVLLYFTSYITGLAVLYFLSMLHVIFEFPLNFQTFKEIGKLSIAMVRRK